MILQVTISLQRMKLYCDEMLIGLARWLRAAGYDTKIASFMMSDRQLFDEAVEQHRLLITRDRKLIEFREAATTVVLLGCNTLETCIEELSGRLHIDWLKKPFSRCLACNTPLIAAGLEQYEKLPASVKKSVKDIMYCSQCDQLFWEGSHVNRMRKRLNDFNRQYG